MKPIQIIVNQGKRENKLKSPKGLMLYTFISKFYTYGSQTNESYKIMQVLFIELKITF